MCPTTQLNLIFYENPEMVVNMNESISSLVESVDEWLNDENAIVRTVVCITCSLNLKSSTSNTDNVQASTLRSVLLLSVQAAPACQWFLGYCQ